MKNLGIAVALVALFPGIAPAAPVHRLLDAREAIERADTALTIVEAAEKWAPIVYDLHKIPLLCAPPSTGQDTRMDDDPTLYSCCVTLVDGGLGPIIGAGFTAKEWMPDIAPAKASRLLRKVIDEMKAKIEEAGKAPILEQFANAKESTANICLAAASKYP